MDQQTLLYIMTGFVIISAVALVLQFAMLFGIYKTAKVTEEKMKDLLPKAHTLIDSSQKIIDQSRTQILDITSKTNELLDSSKRQMAKVESLLTDATDRAKVHLDRADLILDDTLTRAHQTVSTVHSGVMRPLREIQGVAAGVRSAILHLARGTRPSVDQVTHDEEMFI